jgi:hypothetical protein
MDVKVVNIEVVDRGLYTIVTEKGNVNIHPENILRIERTYTQTQITGESMELDKIYTDKGFIYLASTDPFAKGGQELINSVDFDGLPTWERPNTTWQTVKPYGYSIGTPEKQIPFLFFLLSLQYFSLSLGGIALTILIFPLRLKEEDFFTHLPLSQQEQEQEQECLNKESYNAMAK